jgi:hypothetical protein
MTEEKAIKILKKNNSSEDNAELSPEDQLKIKK